MRQLSYAIIALALCLSVTACSLHPIPNGPGDAIALAAKDLTMVKEAAIIADDSGLVDDELHAKLLGLFEKADGFIVTAQKAHAAGSGGVQGWVDQALALVTQAKDMVPQ